jgi:hypothetical protein
MGAQGTAVLDFGAFPGSNVAYTDVAAPGIIATSAVEAWIRPEATADHTDTDHVAANMRVVAQYVSDGNVRIYGLNNNDVTPPEERTAAPEKRPLTLRHNLTTTRQNAPMFVGLFNINWVWNGP